MPSSQILTGHAAAHVNFHVGMKLSQFLAQHLVSLTHVCLTRCQRPARRQEQMEMRRSVSGVPASSWARILLCQWRTYSDVSWCFFLNVSKSRLAMASCFLNSSAGRKVTCQSHTWERSVWISVLGRCALPVSRS